MTDERTSTLSADIYVYGDEREADCLLCGERYVRHHANVIIPFEAESCGICLQCVIAGPPGAAARARAYAQALKRKIADYEWLAGRAEGLASEVDQMTEWPSLDDLLQAQRSEPALPPDMGAVRNLPF